MVIPKNFLIINAKDINTINLTASGKTSIQSILNKDTEAIRNLSDLANQLTKNGKLVVPGGLEVKGKISCNSLVANKYLCIYYYSSRKRIIGNLVVVGDAKINTGIYYQNDILKITS